MELSEIKGSIAVLISGGVDSAVAVHMLCEAGHRPDLHYIKIGMEGEDSSCTAEEDIELSIAQSQEMIGYFKSYLSEALDVDGKKSSDTVLILPLSSEDVIPQVLQRLEYFNF